MPNNDEKIIKALEALQTNVTGIKGDITSIKKSQAQTNTALEALKAGQDDIREKMATKVDVQDLKAEVVKKIKDHAERIEELEKETGLPHPHKH